jgi:hypothetical protein
MNGPYRSPALVHVDPLPNACVPDRAVHASFPLPPAFAKALAAAATLLLLMGSASLGAITWTVVTTPARSAPAESAMDAQRALQSAQYAFPLAPRSARREASRREPAPRQPSLRQPPRRDPPPSQLSALGPETHDVEVLWARALRLAAKVPGRTTLQRATIPASAMTASALAHEQIRVAHEDHPGASGLRVLSLDARSAPAQAGLLPGDLVTGINGFALQTPGAFSSAWTGATTAQAVVVELQRGGRPLALRVDWRR